MFMLKCVRRQSDCLDVPAATVTFEQSAGEERHRKSCSVIYCLSKNVLSSAIDHASI